MSKSRRHPPQRLSDPAAPPAPLGRRIAAFDLGARRIGAAITDGVGAFVAWRGVIERRSVPRDREAIGALLDSHPQATILVGLPLRIDGTEGEQARRTRRWTQAIFSGRKEPIVYRDERFTSHAAARAGAARDSLDAYAAETLLMDFLRDPQLT